MHTFEPLNPTHQVGAFECGNEALDNFIKTVDLTDRETDVFVLADGGAVVGYVCKRFAEVEHVADGAAKVPVIVLPAIAVDARYQKQGHCRGLFARVLLNCLIENSAQDWDMVGCLPVHPATIKLCNGFGFVKIGRANGYHWISRDKLSRSFQI